MSPFLALVLAASPASAAGPLCGAGTVIGPGTTACSVDVVALRTSLSTSASSMAWAPSSQQIAGVTLAGLDLAPIGGECGPGTALVGQTCVLDEDEVARAVTGWLRSGAAAWMRACETRRAATEAEVRAATPIGVQRIDDFDAVVHLADTLVLVDAISSDCRAHRGAAYAALGRQGEEIGTQLVDNMQRPVAPAVTAATW